MPTKAAYKIMALFGTGLVADYFSNRKIIKQTRSALNERAPRLLSFPVSVNAAESERYTMNNRRKKDVVLVTGASGFVGQHIVKILQEYDDNIGEIRVFDKRPYTNNLGHDEKTPVKSIVGDLCSGSDMETALTGVNTVIHTAGIVSFGTFPDFDAMERVNVKGTGNLIECCVRQNVERLVFTSTIDVVIGYDDIIDGDEDQPIPNTFLFPGYPDTKCRAEKMVIEANGSPLPKGNGACLNTISLRPNVMYGEGDPFFIPNGLRAAKNNCGILPRIGNGKALFQQSYVGNTAWAHLCAVKTLRQKPEVGGKSFFIPDDTPLCNSFEFMEPFLKSKGFRLSQWSVPYPIIYCLLFATEAFLKLISPLYKFNMDTPLCSITYINKSYYFNRKRAEKELGYKPLYSYKESLQNSIQFYKDMDL